MAENNTPSTVLEEQVVDIIERMGGTAKAWYESKTVVFNGLAIVVAVAMLLGFADHPAPEAAGQVTGAIVAVVAAVNTVLRLVTSEPVR